MYSIIEADVLDGLRSIDDESVHAIVTSPPYFVGKSYEDHEKRSDDIVGNWRQYVDWLVKVFAAAHDALVPGGHLWINIDDSHTSIKSAVGVNMVLPTHAVLITELMDMYHYKEMVLWRKIRSKRTSGGSRRMLGSYGRLRSPGSIPIVQEVEYILWFKKPGSRTVTDDMRIASALSPGEFKTFGMQVWDIQPLKTRDRMGHEAPYPVEVPERCIKLSTFVGDTVLDPFSGTASTGVAAIRNNRNYIGIERDGYWVQESNRRLSSQPLQFMNARGEL